MKKIGLTGGIGSGKSWIASVFEKLGVPVYNSDNASKEILFNSKEVHSDLLEYFGKEVFTNNIPDRKKIAALVFNNQEALQKLNNILHPRVGEHFENWLKLHSDKAYIIKEAAILFETGIYKKSDFNILVTAPLETRIERVMKRDNISREEVLGRISKQWSDKEKIKLADFVIENDGKKAVLIQVLDIHYQLIK
jgi:dephospho-CoA kinase